MAVMQQGTEKSGKGDPKVEDGEEDLRLERIVARLREPLRGGELAQPCRTEPACSASQVSIGRTSTASMLHLISLRMARHRRLSWCADTLIDLRG